LRALEVEQKRKGEKNGWLNQHIFLHLCVESKNLLPKPWDII
jgi:hypothetical protein